MTEKVNQSLEDVRAGKKMITDDYRVVDVLPQSSTNFPTLEEWEGSESTALEQLARGIEADEKLTKLQQGVNLQRISIYAWEEAENKQSSQGSEKAADDDWLRRWRNYAKDVSSEQLQRMWAKILVEETVEPDSYSFHTLELLNRLSKHEATIISTLASFELMTTLPTYNKFYSTYEKVGITLSDLIHLENLGLLNGTTAIDTLTTLMGADEDGTISYLQDYGEYGLLIQASNRATIELKGTVVAPIGKEVFSLIPNKGNVDNIKESGIYFAKQLGGDVQVTFVKITNRLETNTVCEPLERLGYDE